MLSFSPEKLFIVGLIALMVLGPRRLPEAARAVGRFVATFRRVSSGFQAEVREALVEPKRAFNAAVGDFRPPDVTASLRDVMSITSALSHPTPPPGAPSVGTLLALAEPSGSPDRSPPAGTPDDPSLN